MAFPRMMARAGSFAFVTVPERIDSMLGFRSGGSVIAEVTGNKTWSMVSAAMSSGSSADSAAPTASGATVVSEGVPRGFGPLGLLQIRNFGGIFTYMTSKWALACFTLVSFPPVLLPANHGH